MWFPEAGSFFDRTPRSIWLSGAGGVSVAYVFVHVLPEIAKAQDQFRSLGTGWLVQVELHTWLLALFGLTTFYGLERLIKQHYRRERDREATRRAAGVFWIHTISFAIYNVLFGYLLMHRERPAISGLVVYGTAIGLHFLVTDYGLRRDHRADYDRIVRWVLAAAVLFGWYLGT